MMKLQSITIFLLLTLSLHAQSKKEYLEKNRFDLTHPDFVFPQSDFKILGFGAYHGSAKTEDAEIALLRALIEKNGVQYYLPETDFSIAHYFNEYLQTGDTVLLKDLVMHYGTRVPQERTIEVYEKWKNIKAINDGLANNKKLKVIGLDLQVSFKYAAIHIIELSKPAAQQTEEILELKNLVASDTTDFQSGFNGHARAVMKNFVASYEKNPSQYDTPENRTEFSHIVKNLKTVFESFQGKREPTIFENYLELDKVYDFKNKPQFLRYGFSHLMKSKQGKKGYPYFFTLLIENNIYKKEEVIAVVGYLTKSEVLWDATFDANGNYNGYTTKAGFGIGDYWKEYFKGIKNLKKTKLSDKTLYRLNQKDTPYSSLEPDLIEVKMIFSKSNKKEVRNLATASFLDYAILIVDSKASRPVQEME